RWPSATRSGQEDSGHVDTVPEGRPKMNVRPTLNHLVATVGCGRPLGVALATICSCPSAREGVRNGCIYFKNVHRLLFVHRGQRRCATGYEQTRDRVLHRNGHPAWPLVG